MAFFNPTRCLHAIVSLSTSTTTTKFQQIRRSYNPNIFVENLLDFITFWCNEKLRFADNVFAFFSQSFSLRYSGKVSITWPEVPYWLNGKSCVSRIEPKTNTQTKKQNWTNCNQSIRQSTFSSNSQKHTHRNRFYFFASALWARPKCLSWPIEVFSLNATSYWRRFKWILLKG